MTVNTITLYHNPRCSKSRATLELMQERGHTPHIIEYLKTPLNAHRLLDLASKLEQPVSALLRVTDTEADLSEMNDEQLAQYLSKNPKLIQRPIVVSGHQARIGRPPESILEILP